MLLILLFCFLAITVLAFQVFKVSTQEIKIYYNRGYQYRKRERLLTSNEHHFFNQLLVAIDSKYFVFPQIHLSSLFDHKINGQSWRGALSSIQRKSVDFVLCDKSTLEPIIAIELDDPTHNLPHRKIRDEYVEKIFSRTGLPLLRIGTSANYQANKLLEVIETTIHSSAPR